jgi:hypothetical protein
MNFKRYDLRGQSDRIMLCRWSCSNRENTINHSAYDKARYGLIGPL